MKPERVQKWYFDTDRQIRNWMKRFGIPLLRISLGMVFTWFGALKFFPYLSPAETLAQQTLEILTFGMISPELGIRILAVWECLIGVGLLLGKGLRLVLLLLAFQMIGAMSPVVLFPEQVFQIVPWAPTLEGQYIVKNLVLISAAIVVGAAVERPAWIYDQEDLDILNGRAS